MLDYIGIKIRQCITIILLAISIAVSYSTFVATPTLIDSDMTVEEWSTGYDCEIYLIFDCGVGSSSATIALYDENRAMIQLYQDEYAYSDLSQVSSIHIYDMDICPYYYSIHSYSASSSPLVIGIACIVTLILLILFISTLTIRYREYSHGADIISVYSSSSSARLRVNGVLADGFRTSRGRIVEISLKAISTSANVIIANIDSLSIEVTVDGEICKRIW